MTRGFVFSAVGKPYGDFSFARQDEDQFFDVKLMVKKITADGFEVVK